MDLPSWWSDTADRKKQNRTSAAQERSIAQKVKGKVQPGSGSSWRAPGDIRTDKYLIETKYTKHDSFSLTKNLWKDIKAKAYQQGKEPVLVIELNYKYPHTSTRLIVTEEE